MRLDNVDEALAQGDPARSIDLRSPQISSALDALRQEIADMDNISTRTLRHHRRTAAVVAVPRPLRRYKIVAATIAAVVSISASAVAASVLFSPDPVDLAAIEKDSEQGATVHGSGWRPELATESALCVYEDSSAISPPDPIFTVVSDFPLGEQVTVERILDACRSTIDTVSTDPAPPSKFTLCEGAYPAEGMIDEIWAQGDTTPLSVDARVSLPAFPVVLAWDAACEATTLDTFTPISLTSFSSLATLNSARGVEIALRAESIRRCIPMDEAKSLATNAVAELGNSWIPAIDRGPAGSCYEVRLDLRWGLVSVGLDDTEPLDPSTGADSPK